MPFPRDCENVPGIGQVLANGGPDLYNGDRCNHHLRGLVLQCFRALPIPEVTPDRSRKRSG